MYKSCKLTSFGGEFTIVDDDFIVSIRTNASLFNAIAIVYEERGLSVAPNLAIALRQYKGTVQNPLNYYATWNPKLLEYREEIEKYLMLL